MSRRQYLKCYFCGMETNYKDYLNDMFRHMKFAHSEWQVTLRGKGNE